MIQIKIVNKPIITVKTDLAIVTLCKDMVPLKGYVGEIDWLLSAHISSLIRQEKIFGTYKETTLLNSHNKLKANKILLFGLGNRKNLSPTKLHHAYSAIAKTVLNLKAFNFCFGLLKKELPQASYSNIGQHILNGVFSELGKLPSSIEITVTVVEEEQKNLDKLTQIVKKLLLKHKNNLFSLQ